MLRWSYFTIMSFFYMASYSQVSTVGSEKIKMIISGHPLKIPYFSNHSIDIPRKDISKAIIVMHGVERNADEYYDNMISASFMRPQFSDSTIIIAPQLLTEEDIVFHKLDKEHLYWTEGGWTSGSNSRNESSNPRPARITSFAVLDSIMTRLESNFSGLKAIVFAGHSAGGQLVNRYSASSPVPEDLCNKNNIPVKFMVANPGSYVYLDNKRAVNGTLDKFEVPGVVDCSGYNKWRYGLDELFTYPAQYGRDAIRRFLAKRNVAYLLGELDNNPNASNLDNSCEAKLQGKHRLERGLIYYNYLKSYYGANIVNTQSLDIVSGVGHDNFKMFTSAKGLFHLFETTPKSCNQSSSLSDIGPQEFDFTLYPNPADNTITINIKKSGGNIDIFNFQGIKIFSSQDTNVSEIKYDISSLPNGMYLIHYRNGVHILKKTFVKN